MTLNLIYQGTSTNYELAGLMGLSDADIRHVAEEVHGLPEGSLYNFVVDYVSDYVCVRPKVPFGASL
jgi:hypothetical protein